MPVKHRVAKGRRPTFPPEVVALFSEIERLPGDHAFKDNSHQLARMLGLTDQWWTGNQVNDRSRAPCHGPWCQAHTDWHTCREVRLQLLAAAKGA
jgi:hypothetical protein